MALVEDQGVWPLLISLRDCLCTALAEAGGPAVCQCEVLPGALAIHDFGDEGQAWVRLVNAFPSVQFPIQDQTSRSCGAPLAYEVEVGVYRCAPLLNEDGSPPGAEEQFEATRLQMSDMAAMRRAIQCCFGTKNAVLGSYTPIGPEGTSLGGTWSVWVRG